MIRSALVVHFKQGGNKMYRLKNVFTPRWSIIRNQVEVCNLTDDSIKASFELTKFAIDTAGLLNCEPGIYKVIEHLYPGHGIFAKRNTYKIK